MTEVQSTTSLSTGERDSTTVNDETLLELTEAYERARQRREAASQIADRSDTDQAHYDVTVDEEDIAARALLAHVPRDINALKVKTAYIRREFMPPKADEFAMTREFAKLYIDAVMEMWA